jgi:tetratricopeptide (TPR) repeat protein
VPQTDSKHLIKEKALELFPTTWKGLKKSKDDDSDSDSDDDVEDEAANDTPVTNENGQSEEDEVSFIDKHNILGVLGLFDVEPTATGYRVVAELLLKFGHREPAESTCKKTLDLIQANATTSPLERFKALVLMAQVLSKRGKRYSARDYVTQFATDEYLKNEDIPSAVKQAALVTKARIEAKNDDLESASQAYLDAKLADPSKLTPGHILDEEISLFSEPESVESYFKTLKRWTILERLTWLAWDFDGGGERRDILTDTAAKHGELDLVIETYENAIKYLDNVDAGAPFRCALSRVFSEARGDLERAKALLDEVLDSGSTGWPYAVTDQSADDVLEEAMRLLTGIIYTMFCESKDPVKKQKLLDEARGLTSRPLALDVPPISETHMVCHRLPINRMVLKMGSAVEFQKRMRPICTRASRGSETKSAGTMGRTSLSCHERCTSSPWHCRPVRKGRSCSIWRPSLPRHDSMSSRGNTKPIQAMTGVATMSFTRTWTRVMTKWKKDQTRQATTMQAQDKKQAVLRTAKTTKTMTMTTTMSRKRPRTKANSSMSSPKPSANGSARAPAAQPGCTSGGGSALRTSAIRAISSSAMSVIAQSRRRKKGSLDASTAVLGMSSFNYR